MKTQLQQYLKSGDAYQLSGPARKKDRQAVMQIITGIKLPIARCGVNNLMRGLIEVSGVTGSCLAHKERALTEWFLS